jgi:hypothetical protein
MPLYISAHSTACLTKQALRKIIGNLTNAREVKVRRCLASQIGGRMLTEIEAADRSSLEKFFQSHLINCEWIMPIDLDAKDGTLTEY